MTCCNTCAVVLLEIFDRLSLDAAHFYRINILYLPVRFALLAQFVIILHVIKILGTYV